MITYTQLERSDTIQQIRSDYLHTLAIPQDGWWEGAIIANATFWEIRDQEQQAGHFCLDANNSLLRFHLWEEYQPQAQKIFRDIISTYAIQQAITTTIEPLYFSLCLDAQKSITPHSYLFRDHRRVELSVELSNSIFRPAQKSELDLLTRFYQENTEGSGEGTKAFLSKRCDQEELFVWYHQDAVVATGECIPSQNQPPYTDLGMVVAQSYRGKGLGSSVLIRLKEHCYAMGWKPICACAFDNYASKKAIEKAGFLSEQRIVKVTF